MSLDELAGSHAVLEISLQGLDLATDEFVQWNLGFLVFRQFLLNARYGDVLGRCLRATDQGRVHPDGLCARLTHDLGDDGLVYSALIIGISCRVFHTRLGAQLR